MAPVSQNGNTHYKISCIVSRNRGGLFIIFPKEDDHNGIA